MWKDIILTGAAVLLVAGITVGVVWYKQAPIPQPNPVNPIPVNPTPAPPSPAPVQPQVDPVPPNPAPTPPPKKERRRLFPIFPRDDV